MAHRRQIFTSKNNFKGLQEAFEAIEEESDLSGDEIELDILPPPLDPMTDDEEFDDNDMITTGTLPRDVPGSIEVANLATDEEVESLDPTSTQRSEATPYLRLASLYKTLKGKPNWKKNRDLQPPND